jgi:vomeronasal 2 receptor
MDFFQLNTFLKEIDERDNMSLDWRQKLNAEYDILNLWNLPKGLGLKVKIGSFSANTAQHQQLSLSEEMIQWPEGFLDVSYVFNQCFVVMLIINVYFLIQLHLFSD